MMGQEKRREEKRSSIYDDSLKEYKGNDDIFKFR